MSGRRAVGALAVAAAVLFCAAVVAVGVIEDSPVGPREGQVGTAGLSRSALLDDEATTRTTESTVAVAPPTSVSTAQPAPTTTTASPTTRSTLKGSTASTVPPPPPGPPPTGIPNIAPASSWSSERDGVSARLRIDPATPVAGQAVRFFVEVSSAEPCCTVMLDFGDGVDGFSLNNGVPCGSLTPGTKSAQTSHTYAAAGAYKARLTVMTGMACQPPLEPGQAPSLPVFHSVDLSPCIAVGPGTTGQGGCSPFPTFGPDSIISPVLDPFCQVRSDCSKASPPR